MWSTPCELVENANKSKLLSPRVIDTNVPLTAAGYNDDASETCQTDCEIFIEKVLLGELVVVIDDEYEALDEYSSKVPPHGRSADFAGRFLIHLYQNQGNEALVRLVALPRMSNRDYLDFPDRDNSWTSDEPRCKQFDEDDKKWVALARRFRIDAGKDAPIVNAGDRCWLAFETQLRAAGVTLEFLCADEPTPPPTDARG